MVFRKAKTGDLKAVAAVYDAVHTAEEAGRGCTGWVRGVYPTAETAQFAQARGELFVAEEGGAVVAAAIINREQPDAYRKGAWSVDADEVTVLHTLAVDPAFAGRGCGTGFVRFYEAFALASGCRYLRLDTQVKNRPARSLYVGLGYREIGVVPCTFNGIEGVELVLMEKTL